MEMNERYFSILDALQLVGVFPCLFIIGFLCIASRRHRRIILPVSYFLVLGVGLCLPLVPIFFPHVAVEFYAGMQWVRSLLPALAFLLIMQLMRAHVPEPRYWLILIALMAMNGFSYGLVGKEGYCLASEQCYPAEAMQSVISIVSTGVIFLILMPIVMRRYRMDETNKVNRAQKYWLILALILLHLSLPATELFLLTEQLTPTQYMAIRTVIVFSFIYLVMTSLFRVFDDALQSRYSRQRKAMRDRLSDTDRAFAKRIDTWMVTEKPYRTMGYSREACADALNVPEHKLSRLLNLYYDKNFNEFVNYFRIEEAKERLLNEAKTTVTVVAFEVGFNSIASFNRVFKEMVGVSPTAYRKDAG